MATSRPDEDLDDALQALSLAGDASILIIVIGQHERALAVLEAALTDHDVTPWSLVERDLFEPGPRRRLCHGLGALSTAQCREVLRSLNIRRDRIRSEPLQIILFIEGYLMQEIGPYTVDLRAWASVTAEVGAPESSHAVAISADTVARYRTLAENRPDMDIVTRDAGELDEARRAGAEAVEKYRALAAKQPEKFSPDLVEALHVYSDVLYRSGEPREAVQAIVEAIDVMWPYFVHEPAASASYMQALLAAYSRYLDDTPASKAMLARFQRFAELTAAMPEHPRDDQTVAAADIDTESRAD